MTVTSRPADVPDFLIIGAMKSGTNTLYDYICQHPDVRRSATHEVHYFDNQYWKGMDWYRRQFPSEVCGPRTWITGESSPYYLFHPLVPERVAEALPAVRLLAVLRNPVDRAYSHYQHQRAMGREQLEFAEALAREPRRTHAKLAALSAGSIRQSSAVQHFSYRARGRYAEQLGRWLGKFQRDQLCVLRAEELYEEPHAVMPRVFEFLRLRPMGNIGYRKLNARSYATMDPEIRAELSDYYRPHVRELSSLLGTDMWWEG